MTEPKIFKTKPNETKILKYSKMESNEYYSKPNKISEHPVVIIIFKKKNRTQNQ